MYPETDVTTVKPKSQGIVIPQLLTERASAYMRHGIKSDLAHSIIREGVEQFFEQMIETNPNVNSSYIAEVLISYSKDMERRKLDYTRINDTHLIAVFSAVNNNTMAKESLMDALADVASGQSLDLSRYKTMTDAELKKELQKIITTNPNLPLNALIGNAMGKLRGKAEGRKIVTVLKKLVES